MAGLAGPRTRRRVRGGAGLFLAAPVALLVVGCQAVLGDFTVAPAPDDVPEQALGTVCEPGEFRCTDAALETCNDARNGWTVAEVCESAAACNLNTRNCRACVNGEVMCRGAALERCNEGTWQEAGPPCATPALCRVSADRMSGECLPPVCDVPGEHACSGPLLVRCPAGRDRLEPVALCATRELCDAAFANELAASGQRGACRPPACGPDEFLCDGATLRHCANERTGWDEATTTCESNELCSARHGACGPCEPEEIECNGAELRRCGPSGIWQRIDTCASPGLCDEVIGSCHEPECDEPGAVRCGSEFPELHVCSTDRRWERVAVCATVELCSASAARCLPPACEENETRCFGNRHERCSVDRTRWEPTMTCGESEHCDPAGGCLPGTCTEGATRCNGPLLERCTSGRFQEQERCATALLCNAQTASCTPPMCEAGTFNCKTQTIVQRCLPDGSDYRDHLTCTGTATCDAMPPLGIGPECDACEDDAYSCDETDLMRCSSDGQVLSKVRSCPTSCTVTGGVPDCR